MECRGNKPYPSALTSEETDKMIDRQAESPTGTIFKRITTTALVSTVLFALLNLSDIHDFRVIQITIAIVFRFFLFFIIIFIAATIDRKLRSTSIAFRAVVFFIVTITPLLYFHIHFYFYSNLSYYAQNTDILISGGHVTRHGLEVLFLEILKSSFISVISTIFYYYGDKSLANFYLRK